MIATTSLFGGFRHPGFKPRFSTPCCLVTRTDRQKPKIVYIYEHRNVNTQDSRGRTDLHRAVLKGNMPRVLSLLRAGAKPDIQDADGFTALHIGVHRNRFDLVNLLLAAGADVNIPDDDGCTPLHTMMFKNNVKLLMRMIYAGAKINAQDRDGFTPLMFGAQQNALGNVAVLLKCGADPNIRNKYGQAPIHWAYDQRFVSMVELLKVKGAVWDFEDGNEVDEMRLLAAAWGIPGVATINGMTVARDACPISRRPFWILSDIMRADAPEIADAFAADKDLDLTKRLAKIKKGEELVTVQSGSETHATVLVFYRGYLAICDRGLWGPTKVYKINPSKMTSEHCKAISKTPSQTDSEAMIFYERLIEDLDGTQDEEICKAFMSLLPQKDMKGGFCGYDSPEAAIFTILTLDALINKVDPAVARGKYKNLTTLFRLMIADRYLSLIEKGKIKMSAIDKELLREILSLLSDDDWHPERFKAILFAQLKKTLLVRLKKVV